jgi:hypothetical protein
MALDERLAAQSDQQAKRLLYEVFQFSVCFSSAPAKESKSHNKAVRAFHPGRLAATSLLFLL